MGSAENQPGPLAIRSACPICQGDHAADEPCAAAVVEQSGSTQIIPSSGSTSSSPGSWPGGPDPLVGTMVGSFRVVRRLGQGGMGTVYLAEHPIIGSRVAVKFLHESFSSNADLVRRFYDEAKAVNLIGHENIVSIYDLSFLPPGRYYIVMEYLEGEPLSAHLRQGPMEPAAALPLLIQVCDALKCAHARGVVHRDLKPDNVFLVDRGERGKFVKVVDFGIAKLRAEGAGSATAVGMLMGTPGYMAPEQCDNRPVDARTDIYALGVIAYQLATGQLPFSEPSLPRLLMAHLGRPPTPPRELRATVPPGWEQAILKALAKRPEDRFQDMGDFARALAGALEVASLPTLAPVHSRHMAGFEVEVRDESGHAQRLRAVDISRGGMLLCATDALPPLLSRVMIALPEALPGAQPGLTLAGEVVRHISPAEAEAWDMDAGFALQFTDLTPALRASIAALVAQIPRIPRRVAPLEPSDDLASAAALDRFRKPTGASHYDFLGVAADADFPEIKGRIRALRAEAEGLRDRPLSPAQASQLQAALQRIDAAQAALGNAPERLDHDTLRGNFPGVARCLATGIAKALIDTRRRAFLAQRPEVEQRVAIHLGRAKLARGRDNLPAALKEYEQALALDPLNLSLHEVYWSLKRREANR